MPMYSGHDKSKDSWGSCLILLLGCGAIIGLPFLILYLTVDPNQLAFQSQVTLADGRVVYVRDELRKQFLSELGNGKYCDADFPNGAVEAIINDGFWNSKLCPKCPEMITFFETREGESFFSYPIYTPYTDMYGKFTLVLGTWTGNRTGVGLRVDPVIYITRNGQRLRIPLDKRESIRVLERGKWKEVLGGDPNLRTEAVAQVKKYYEN